MERVRVRGTEIDSLNCLMTILTMAHRLDGIGARIKRIPRGGMRAGQIKKASESLLEDVCKTIPENQLKTIERNLQNLHYVFGVTSPGRGLVHDEFGVWVSSSAFDEMLNVMHEHCKFCDKTESEQRGCKLAKALDTLPSDKDENVTYGCGYFGREY